MAETGPGQNRAGSPALGPELVLLSSHLRATHGLLACLAENLFLQLGLTDIQGVECGEGGVACSAAVGRGASALQSPGHLYPNKTDSGSVQACGLSAPTAPGHLALAPWPGSACSPGCHWSPSDTSTLTAPSGDGATADSPRHQAEKPLPGLGPRASQHSKLGFNLKPWKLLVGQLWEYTASLSAAPVDDKQG